MQSTAEESGPRDLSSEAVPPLTTPRCRPADSAEPDKATEPATAARTSDSRRIRLRPQDLHALAIKGLRTGNRGRLATCEALRSLHESSGFVELGFSTVAGYASARLCLRRTECYEHLRVSRALVDLPELRRAFAEGELGWTVLKAMTRVARPGTQQAWLQCLAERGPEHTIAECRRALREGRDEPREAGGGMPNLDQKIVLRFSRTDMEKVYRWLESIAERIRESTGAEELTLEQVILFASEQAVSFGSAEGGPSNAAFTSQIVYHRCPDCARSAMATSDGLVEMEPSELDRHAGCADPVVIDGPTPPKLRRQILARESQRCGNPHCSRPAEHCHHIVFRSQGGATNRHNEVAVCATCHALIHAGLLEVKGRVEGPAGAGLQWTPVPRSERRLLGAADSLRDLPVWIRSGGGGESANADDASAASGASAAPNATDASLASANASASTGAGCTPDPPQRAGSTGADVEALAMGLVRLGFSKAEARDAIHRALRRFSPGDTPSEADVLRAALSGKAPSRVARAGQPSIVETTSTGG